jgi:hypothetical protein
MRAASAGLEDVPSVLSSQVNLADSRFANQKPIRKDILGALPCAPFAQGGPLRQHPNDLEARLAPDACQFHFS